MRIALGVQYSGARYHGWQKQVHLKTVQTEVENALTKIAHHPVQVICAGRTDTGVHAVGQVIHFDTTAKRDKAAWLFGTNSLLPNDISITWAMETSEDFHARFKATARHYRYFIYNRPIRSALVNEYMTWHYNKLNHESMLEASRALLGEHDFTSYRALACQAKSPIKTITELNIERHGDVIVLDLHANAFLHHMVRNIVGVLLQIGTGKQAPEWALEVLKARDRRLGGITAPPYGLYLGNVTYPELFSIPTMPLPFLQL